MPSSDDVFSHIEAHEGRYLEELVELLRFPSISTDPAHKDDVEACSLHLCEQLEQIGLTAERFDRRFADPPTKAASPPSSTKSPRPPSRHPTRCQVRIRA